MKRLGRDLSAYCLLSLLYLILVIILPANKTAMHLYHLSVLEYHVLLFIVVLPLIAIWFTAFYAYTKLRQYSASISKTTEGTNFGLLTTGTRWLAWGLPIPALISLVLNAIANTYSGFHATDVIIVNYISLLVPLVAFSLISNGSRGLVDVARQRISTNGAKLLTLLFMILGVFYCYLTFRHLNLASLGNANNQFYLPISLLLLTIVIPYLYIWFIGLLAAYEISQYGKNSRGLLYRQPLRVLASGFVAVIASSIALQYLSSVEPRTGHLSLNSALAITYMIRIVAALGYILIAIGARRLKKIEEV
jgi:hypothetical protein